MYIVQLHDDENNIDISPVVLSKGIKNKKGESLENVEANAQENVIECIEHDGETLTPVLKKVSIPGYKIVKKTIPNPGMSATYQLCKGNTPVSDEINILAGIYPESGSCKICEQKDVPVEGYEVGDWYLDFVLSNSAHIYINIKQAIASYTEGEGIKIQENKISIDDTVVVTHEQLNQKKFVSYNVLE